MKGRTEPCSRARLLAVKTKVETRHQLTMNMSSAATERWYGRMVAPSKDTGSMASLWVSAFSEHLSPYVRLTRASGSKIVKLIWAYSDRTLAMISRPTSNKLQRNPSLISLALQLSRMEKASRYGAMEATIMAHSAQASKKVKVSTTGPMVVSTREHGVVMKWAALVASNGLTAATSRDNSRTVWCTDTETTCGKMVVSTKASTNSIRSMDTVLTPTRMEASIEESGMMVCSMA